MKRWRLSRQAEIDELEIWMYLAVRNFTAADEMIMRLKEAYRGLARFPESGRPQPELGPGLRSIPVGQYLVIYRVEDGRPHIARVVHGARNLDRLFAE